MPSSTLAHAGRHWDNDAALYQNNARWYDPGTGRFISEDPIGFADGANPYRYVGNNPVNFVDPTGLFQAGNPLASLGSGLGLNSYTPLSSYGSRGIVGGIANEAPSLSGFTDFSSSLFSTPISSATLAGTFDQRAAFGTPTSQNDIFSNYVASGAYADRQIAIEGQKIGEARQHIVENYGTAAGHGFDVSIGAAYAPGIAINALAQPVLGLQDIGTVYRNTEGQSEASRLYTSLGTYAATSVGIRGIDDFFHTHDAVDGHVQSTFEQYTDLATGSLQLTGVGSTIGRGVSGSGLFRGAVAPNRAALAFVGENLGTPRNAALRAARDFESGTIGAFSDVATRQRFVPALRFNNPKSNGAGFVKFDGFNQLDNGIIELIDAKTRIVPFSTRQGPFISPSVRDGLVRKSLAIEQNPGFRSVLEFPSTAAHREAQQVLRQLGITNISTRVRP